MVVNAQYGYHEKLLPIHSNHLTLLTWDNDDSDNSRHCRNNAIEEIKEFVIACEPIIERLHSSKVSTQSKLKWRRKIINFQNGTHAKTVEYLLLYEFTHNIKFIPCIFCGENAMSGSNIYGVENKKDILELISHIQYVLLLCFVILHIIDNIYDIDYNVIGKEQCYVETGNKSVDVNDGHNVLEQYAQ